MFLFSSASCFIVLKAHLIQCFEVQGVIKKYGEWFFLTKKFELIPFKLLFLASNAIIPMLIPWLEAFPEGLFRKGLQLLCPGPLIVGNVKTLSF